MTQKLSTGIVYASDSAHSCVERLCRSKEAQKSSLTHMTAAPELHRSIGLVTLEVELHAANCIRGKGLGLFGPNEYLCDVI